LSFSLDQRSGLSKPRASFFFYLLCFDFPPTFSPTGLMSYCFFCEKHRFVPSFSPFFPLTAFSFPFSLAKKISRGTVRRGGIACCSPLFRTPRVFFLFLPCPMTPVAFFLSVPHWQLCPPPLLFSYLLSHYTFPQMVGKKIESASLSGRLRPEGSRGSSFFFSVSSRPSLFFNALRLLGQVKPGRFSEFTAITAFFFFNTFFLL